jgi:RHH-type proline utilization regulon transcriptional repressor/proline dehydrogenase/delta 1-pyrroline-5-carboxylate dehydrogenase
LATGPALFAPRQNSQGWDLTDTAYLAAIDAARTPFLEAQIDAAPRLAGRVVGGPRLAVLNPATGALVGHVLTAGLPDVDTALRLAEPWSAAAPQRAEVLNRAADRMEADFGRIFALLAREAGKTLADAVAELREAVDFLRYYAGQAAQPNPARGVFACISPWNFPLAIFCGQISAALAAGNAVLAKPAEQTPLIATLAVDHLLAAGVPSSALQLLPGDGSIGAALTRDPRVNGVAFTGSTETAQAIRRSMADHLDPTAPLIAETGGLNAMLVDSTALPEQAVRDIIASSFQSAGQRCSALRCLYVQEDVAHTVTEMLFGAMEDLSLGDPWALSTDIGPVIDAEAQAGIRAYVDAARAEGRVLKELKSPGQGTFVAPIVLSVKGIADMPREIFGPVLHVATFKASEIDDVIASIGATGYGLTFGLHSRIDDRVQSIVEGLKVGNTYVNRNQIGAVVGSQPFGGEGLSGTGPKAGGPHYLTRFTRAPVPKATPDNATTSLSEVARSLAAPWPATEPHAQDMPGPTGESNRLTLTPRAPVLCLGPGRSAALQQAECVRKLGGHAVEAPGLDCDTLATLQGFSGAVWWGEAEAGRPFAQALAQRQGPILPLIDVPDAGHVHLERHLCIDTTASGGNAQLLAAVADA